MIIFTSSVTLSALARCLMLLRWQLNVLPPVFLSRDNLINFYFWKDAVTLPQWDLTEWQKLRLLTGIKWILLSHPITLLIKWFYLFIAIFSSYEWNKLMEINVLDVRDKKSKNRFSWCVLVLKIISIKMLSFDVRINKTWMLMK